MLLIIPSLFIIVPLYRRKYGENGQDIVDRPKSAAIWNWGNLTVIADHVHQENFFNLNKSVPGKTVLYIYDKGIKRYICDSSEIGFTRQEGSQNVLYDSKERSVYFLNLDGLMIYTCIKRTSPEVLTVRLTHWKEIK